jgi:hypothetical protein
MRQTKSLVHFEILYVYSKVSFKLLSFLGHSLSPGFELFLTKCRRKTKSPFEEKLSPGVLDFVSFIQKNNFLFFEKDALRLESNIFETF